MRNFKVTSFILLMITFTIPAYLTGQEKGSWRKYESPVLGGGDLGTIFDISVLKEDGIYKMYCSWRPKKSLALSTSTDGINWSSPEIILAPNSKTYWEEEVNRPIVVKKGNIYHMWYTGQAQSKYSWIGYATSIDGINFKRMSDKPVISAEEEWEKVAVMCPHVIWDEKENLFKMWYSGGDQYEPDAIGYATSPDGLNWTKQKTPVFDADPDNVWEQHKVTACQVVKRENDYLMFYIGFRNLHYAQIGMARSKNGIDRWERYSGNPIIAPTPGKWDADACYKPYAIQEKDRWILWYNGRNKTLEQIGVAFYNKHTLDF
ncbi:hypothetical protein [Massilibacteroides sp.]|uniref:hypothetical protein n=1 Tax=Massilibacteroides sp. TaxID=2034766 RepID=UPI002612D260|nr:hypothetical protein [Massilibacteroides sp.]MDD4515852.1 hypothetical protein [Massilibacteroides sp.]